MWYFEAHTRKELIDYLFTAYRFSDLAVLICELLIECPVSGYGATASATCHAGELLLAWLQRDPQLAVVVPALLSCESRSPSGETDIIAEIAAIDRVLNILTSA
jgi:hypothetical protein